MSRSTVVLALFLGLCAACLSLMMIHAPEQVGPAAVLLFPGAILAMITSGNVHDFNAWVVALGNLIFYFALVCLIQALRRRFAPSPH
jgi:hypothetical protein